METLINKTVEMIRLWNANWSNSVIFWSGGKDSTVLLHLLKFRVGLDLPVCQFREPKFRERYAYSDKLIKDWNLTVYDYPPIKTSLTDGPDIETGEVRFDLLKYFQWGSACMVMSLGTERPKENEKFMCGLSEHLARPTGTFNFPWNAVYIGTKNTDADLIKGNVAVKSHIRFADGSPVSLYPLKDWSDDDVYNYLELSGVEPDSSRYIKVQNKWINNPDKSLNADFIPVCLNCVDRHQGQQVYCPKFKAQISNVSEKAPYEDIVIDDLGFKPVDWSRSEKCLTANPAEHVAATNGHGQFSNEMDQIPKESQPNGFATTTR
jgi:hypothetical protein